MESKADVVGCLGIEESAGGVDLLALVMRVVLAVLVSLDSDGDRCPTSWCCSRCCCSGGCWRWEVEEVVPREAVCKSWSKLGSHRVYESASAEGATVVFVASAPSMASISAMSFA